MIGDRNIFYDGAKLVFVGFTKTIDKFTVYYQH